MLEWINQVVDFVARPSILRALVFGLLSGMMLTQWVKFQLPDWLSDAAHARIVRATSSLLAAAMALVLWPYHRHWVQAVAFALVCGLSTPFAYWIAVKALYKFAPWTEDVISARPSTPKEPT